LVNHKQLQIGLVYMPEPTIIIVAGVMAARMAGMSACKHKQSVSNIQQSN